MARFSQPDPSRATRRTVLTALVAVIVISFAIAAVAGITVLLIGPEGDLMSRVLVTTLIVGGLASAPYRVWPCGDAQRIRSASPALA